MHEVIPNVFLSNFQDAKDFAEQQERSNCFQINVSKDLPMFAMFASPGMRIAIDDNQSNRTFVDLLHALPTAMETIDEQLKLGNKVVVHCLAGQQRSAAVVAAYLLFKKVVPTVADAVYFLRAKKKDAFFWAVNFRQPLDIWFGEIQRHA